MSNSNYFNFTYPNVVETYNKAAAANAGGNTTANATAAPMTPVSTGPSPYSMQATNYWNTPQNNNPTQRKAPNTPSAFGYNSFKPEESQLLTNGIMQIYNGPDAVDMRFNTSNNGKKTTITICKSTDKARQKAVSEGELDERGKPQTMTICDRLTYNAIVTALSGQRHPVSINMKRVDENTLSITFTTSKSHSAAIEKALNIDESSSEDKTDGDTTDEEDTETSKKKPRTYRKTPVTRGSDESSKTDSTEPESGTQKQTPHKKDCHCQNDPDATDESSSDESTSKNPTDSEAPTGVNPANEDKTKKNPQTSQRPGIWSGTAFENWHDRINTTRQHEKKSPDTKPRASASKNSPLIPMRANTNDRLSTTNPNRQRYEPVARAAAKAYGLDETIFVRQIMKESDFNPQTGSEAGALGIAQFMPETGARYGLKTKADFTNPEKSLYAAARHMRDLLDNPKVNGDYAKALSMYNSGRPNAYLDATFAKGETHDYVNHILGNPVA